MDTIDKNERKTEEQRKKENAEYIDKLKKNAPKKNRDISKYIGSISKETAEKMQQHILNERNSWE
jgi:hypothetical protein